MSYKVAIIGAARRHQGTGAYIAKNFAQLGHKIVAIVGTSKESTLDAQHQLQQNYSIETQGYLSFNQLLTHHAVDIAVIATPPHAHLSYLEEALTQGCHVFCEKPLWWPEKQMHKSEYMATIEKLISLAKLKNCLIHLNTQWPYTLRYFNQLYPDAIKDQKIHQFAMHLSPQSSGANMLVDAASHGLSMLYQLLGEGEIINTIVHKKSQSSEIAFDYKHSAGITKTELKFTHSNETVKPASYQINGYWVNRKVVLPQYQIQLQSNQQTLKIYDPLTASIEDFLASIDANIETDELALKLGTAHLYQLIEHFNKS